MANWRRALATLAGNVEQRVDALKYGVAGRLHLGDPLIIVPYRGFGSPTQLYLKGRVLEDQGIRSAREDDNLWDNLRNMYRRFETDEVPYARVRASIDGMQQVAIANEEGFFEVRLAPNAPLSVDGLWHQVQLDLVSPLRGGQGPVTATGHVLVPPPTARYGVISDVDDTVIQTGVANLIRMARTVFLSNARMRLPFPGVAAFYRALHAGGQGNDFNPMFYISNSPWNLYDLFSDFFQLQDIPIGPILILRDWGLSLRGVAGPFHPTAYKLAAIRNILQVYPRLPFILVGDSGEKDPEIYTEIVASNPQRILAVYIRNVSRKPQRIQAIQALAEQVVATGSTLVLADDTVPLAEHAAAQGWISERALPGIRESKRADVAPETPLETLLSQVLPPQQPGPTVVVQPSSSGSGSVDSENVQDALQAGQGETQRPPTVIVRPNDGEAAPPGDKNDKST